MESRGARRRRRARKQKERTGEEGEHRNRRSAQSRRIALRRRGIIVLSDPPQAENPAQQDSVGFYSLEYPKALTNASRGLPALQSGQDR